MIKAIRLGRLADAEVLLFVSCFQDGFFDFGGVQNAVYFFASLHTREILEVKVF